MNWDKVFDELRRLEIERKKNNPKRDTRISDWSKNE